MTEITMTLELDVQEDALDGLLEALEGARTAGDDTVRLTAEALGKYDLSIDASRLTVELEPFEDVVIPPLPEKPKKAKKSARKAKHAKRKGLTKKESALMEEMYEAEAKMEKSDPAPAQKDEEKAEKPAGDKKGKHGKSARRGKKTA